MSVNKLAYLDLDIKPQRLYKLETINLACFSLTPSEHLLHTDSPQLNLISDIVLSVLHNQRRSSTSTGITGSLREINEKLEFLRVSNKPLPLSTISLCLQKLENIERKLTAVEEKVELLHEQVQSLL